MINAINLNTDSLVLNIEAFGILKTFIACNTEDEADAILDALYDRYILNIDPDDIEDEKTRAVFNALVAIIDEDKSPVPEIASQPQPEPKPPTRQASERANPQRMPRRAKFFIALIYKDAKAHGEDFLELLKMPPLAAQRYGRESECTPEVEHRVQSWALRVKPTSALVEARRWLKENREAVEQGQFKSTITAPIVYTHHKTPGRQKFFSRKATRILQALVRDADARGADRVQAVRNMDEALPMLGFDKADPAVKEIIRWRDHVSDSTVGRKICQILTNK